MTDTRTSAPHAAGATGRSTTSGLRSLHLVRAAFSLVWVGLVLATPTSLDDADRLTAVAGVLLVAYPLWDTVATLLDRRTAGPDHATAVRSLNLVVSGVATVAMAVAVFTTLGTALVAFGLWALLSGALQLAVALRRRTGAQWPMMISGGLSVLAGVSITASAQSATNGLSTVAGYAAFGAFWFLVSTCALTFRARR